MTVWGRFPAGTEPALRRVAGNRAILLEDFAYERTNGQLWVARTGLIFDGASIPRVFWAVSTNPWADDVLPAAIIHDQYCALGRAGESPYPSGQVHRCFHDALRCLGVPAWRAQARYFAVRAFGPRFAAALERGEER